MLKGVSNPSLSLLILGKAQEGCAVPRSKNETSSQKIDFYSSILVCELFKPLIIQRCTFDQARVWLATFATTKVKSATSARVVLSLLAAVRTNNTARGWIQY